MTNLSGSTTSVDEAEGRLRQAAVSQLRERRDFQAHLTAYTLVNLLLNGIWLVTDPGGFYWPMFPLLGWGIGIGLHALNVYAPKVASEARIQREMRRLSGH
jgi:hypothetical protein